MARKLWPFAIAIMVAGSSGGLLVRSARAHIDPAPVLLEKAAEARARLDYETLVVEGQLFEPGAPPVPVWEGIWSGRAHRREIRRASGVDTILTIDRRRWRFGPEGPGEPTRIRPDPIQVFLVEAEGDPNGRRGLDLLRAYAIDPTVVSMARQDGRPCYVIGAKPWETERPQLWIDVDLMTPSRLVFMVDSVRHELRWTGFDGPLTGPFFPSRYEERQGDDVVVRIDYVRAEPNAPIDDRRFRAPGS